MPDSSDQLKEAAGVPVRIDSWVGHLEQLGYRQAGVVGSGMEGTVISLAGGLVAKLWYRRTASELEVLKTFYRAVGDQSLPFATPTIVEVLQHQGEAATLERELQGQPLWDYTGEESPPSDSATVDCVLTTLAAFAAVQPTPGMAVLPVLDGEDPFDPQAAPFERALARLVEGRVAKFEASLRTRLPSLDAVTTAVVARLNRLTPARPSLLHGDLILANILTSDTQRPSAVLDFGFMTTAGDPAFDAAITASIYDMYGPRAATNEAALDEAIQARFGYEPMRLAIYRAAYALTTSNCFSASGQDGHFDWCIRMLQRPDIREVLEA